MASLTPVFAGAKPQSIRRHHASTKVELRAVEMDPREEVFEFDSDGMSYEDHLRWQNLTRYPNRVGEAEVAEFAEQFVREVRTSHETKLQLVKQRWAEIENILKINSVSRMYQDSDIHVPELYKAIEQLVPRLIEPILEQSPWFHVSGRDESDKRKARVVQEWLAYQLDLTDFDERVEDLARVFFAYGFMAIKTWWEVEYRTKIEQKVERTVEDGKIRLKVKQVDKKVPHYQGCKWELVDPYAFLCDPDRTRANDMRYIGDVSSMGEDELRQKVEEGVYDRQAVQEILEASREDTPSDRNIDWWQRARSLQAAKGDEPEPEQGTARQFDVVEIWANYAPLPGEEFEEYVITAVGDTVVRVQKNPHFNQHRPYCVARSSKDPFEFFGVGPLDHAVRPQMELDDVENIMMEGQTLGLTPIGFTSNDYDGPPSLLGVSPGTMFRGSQVAFSKPPDTVGPGLALKADLQRGIEEITGAIKLYGGTESGGGDTATETERKVKEGNRRLRRQIFNFSGALRTMLRQFLELTRQNVTYEQTFPILGRSAAELGPVGEIIAEDLEQPHDIVITGLRGLQQHGLRSTQIANFASVMYPFMQGLMQEGRLDTGRMVQEAAKSMLGDQLADEIIEPKQPMSELMDPLEENLVLALGERLATHQADEHKEHIRAHEQALQAAKANNDQRVVDAIMEHIARHESKVREQAAREREMAAMSGGEEQLPQLHATQDGRYDQRRDLQGANPNETPKGETPGPGLAHQVSAPDRTNGVPQTENRQ